MADHQIALIKTQFDAVAERRRLNLIRLSNANFSVDDELYIHEVLLSEVELANLADTTEPISDKIKLSGRQAKARVTHVLPGVGITEIVGGHAESTTIGVGANWVLLSISLLAVSVGEHSYDYQDLEFG